MDRSLWAIAVAGVLGLAGWLASQLSDTDRRVFLPGPTSHGHYQIEQQCDACHTPMRGVDQTACLRCHEAELVEADDSHPAAKFRDPRNANRLNRLDVMHCVTCHVEHRPDMTGAMGLSLPEDYCVHCHDDIAEERPSHAAYGFRTCQNAACHNFHDNRALNVEFLQAHLDDPDLLADPRRPALVPPRPRDPRPSAHTPDVPTAPAAIAQAWAGSGHATAGINCSGCHGSPQDDWIDRPTHEACQSCHAPEVEGFLAGHHGMRLSVGLPPLRVGDARRPMRPEAHERTLGCGSCHDVHRLDTRFAAAEACMQCHDDEHTRGYPSSPHGRLWRAELAGTGAPRSGVSCATCHLPPELDPQGIARSTQHNQNDNLRPNEKMVRSVCVHCHGVEFSLAALADPELVQANFAGSPAPTLESFELVAPQTVTKPQ